MELRELQNVCFMRSYKAGWWDYPNPEDQLVFAAKLALVHSEVSEALEGLRKNSKDDHLPHRLSIEVELGDAIIRILDLAGAMGLDIEGAIMEKLEYNAKRADHKLENRAKEGGKKF